MLDSQAANHVLGFRLQNTYPRIYSAYFGPVEWPSAQLKPRHPPHLPKAGLEQQIRIVLEPDTRLEERLERIALAAQAVHDVRARLDERRLEHVREQAEDWVERLEVRGRAGVVGGAVLDAGEQLGEDRQVEDERRREERVLEGVSVEG